MSDSLFDRDTLIYREMMAHTPLFTHRNPQTVAIWDAEDRGTSAEILKHASIATLWQVEFSQHHNPKAKYFSESINEFLEKTDNLDILIVGHHTTHLNFSHCIQALDAEGLLITLCESPFDVAALKNTQQQLRKAGFQDILPLTFPQPNFATGWRSAVMAVKEGTIKRPREKDIFNKTFTTGYYNFDMHKAAFALPEFMREELGECYE